jgi:Holliday junction resolvase
MMIANGALVSRGNVGRLAERIVANELEWRGFRVTELNDSGLSPNADLIAAGQGRIWQVQVKGATNSSKEKWWVQYGHCTQEIINNKKLPMFNRHDSFYKADLVVLVAVRTPAEYRCIVLPVENAEQAVQLNIDRGFRKNTREGQPSKPGKV